MNTIPIAAQSYDAVSITANCSAHAALVLFFLSNEMERARPEAAQTINAGFQTHLQSPKEVSDVYSFHTIGQNAYNAEQIKWCEATIDSLEGQLDEEGRAKRSMPPKKRTLRSAATSAAHIPEPPVLCLERNPAANRQQGPCSGL